jgi:polysaccharide export outer membrane protein
MKYYIYLFSITALLISSCVTQSKINYFQQPFNSQDNVKNDFARNSPIFEIGDILQITLLSSNQEANELFSPTSSQNQRTNQTYTSGSPIQNGFPIDTNGYIEIPYLGQIQALGKTKFELQESIKTQLKEYLIEPIVNIQLLNFKISIVGDVKTPGLYQVPNDKLNIIEAIALAGDLNYSANRKNVKLIRTIGDKQKMFLINLTESNHFDKEYFYLKQNDIIFISTTAVRTNQINYAQYYLPVISSLSLVVTFLNLLNK